MPQQVILIHVVETQVLRIDPGYESTDDEEALRLTAEAQHKHDKVDYFDNVGHIFEVGIQGDRHIDDPVDECLIINLFDKFAQELPKGVIETLEKIPTDLPRLTLELYCILVRHELHLLVLINDVLEAQLLLVELFQPLLSQNRTHLEYQIVIFYHS